MDIKLHIIENMLYMSEVKANHIVILRNIFGANANILGDFLIFSFKNLDENIVVLLLILLLVEGKLFVSINSLILMSNITIPPIYPKAKPKPEDLPRFLFLEISFNKEL